MADLIGRNDEGQGPISAAEQSADVATIETAVAGLAVKGLQFIIDGGVDENGTAQAITTGIKGDVRIPWACTVSFWMILADQTGSIVVDIWKDTYTNYPPTDTESITASAPPTLSSGTKASSSSLTGWTTSFAAGDILRFNVDSASTLTRATLYLTLTQTV